MKSRSLSALSLACTTAVLTAACVTDATDPLGPNLVLSVASTAASLVIVEVPGSVAAGPASAADCRNGGWRTFGFANQGLCIQYVNTGKDSRETGHGPPADPGDPDPPADPGDPGDPGDPDDPGDVSGLWRGTFAWNCSASNQGAHDIEFELEQFPWGEIGGTVWLNGGSAPLSGGRTAEPAVHTGPAPRDPEGMFIRLNWPDLPGFFNNNQVDGAIDPDLDRISGTTNNGDDCSANEYPSGTVEVVRVGES